MRRSRHTGRRVFLRIAAASVAAAASTQYPTLVRAAGVCLRSAVRGSDAELRALTTLTETYGPEFGPVQSMRRGLGPAKR
jgi:hypothetical protein